MNDNQPTTPNELLKLVLTGVFAFLLRLFFGAINVEVDAGTFGAIVAGIVLLILNQLSLALARRAAPNTFK